MIVTQSFHFFNTLKVIKSILRQKTDKFIMSTNIQKSKAKINFSIITSNNRDNIFVRFIGSFVGLFL